MKPKQMYEELLELCKLNSIKVRKETGAFKSGYCIVNEEEYIVINKANPPESLASILARCLSTKIIDTHFIKPAVREFIESERENGPLESDFNLEITEEISSTTQVIEDDSE